MFRWFRRWWTRRKLDKLLAWARTYQMTPEEREVQRRSFVYGNTKISNDAVTRELVDDVAERQAWESKR